eukprot:m51a1_g4978 hypothetical protein (209) ;mRNA; r:30685-31589
MSSRYRKPEQQQEPEGAACQRAGALARELFCSALEQVVEDAEQSLLPGDYDPASDPFASRGRVTLELSDYALRIERHLTRCPAVWVTALVYIDRLQKAGAWVTERNAHRVAFLGVMAAVKANADRAPSNAFLAKVAGLPLAELNRMELEFLRRLDWDLFVGHDCFEAALRSIAHMLPRESDNNTDPNQPDLTPWLELVLCPWSFCALE